MPSATPVPLSDEQLDRLVDALLARLAERTNPPAQPGAGGTQQLGVTLYDATGLPITSLNSLPVTGGGGGGGGAVTVIDGGDVAQGTTTDAAAGTDTANATVVAFWKRLLQRVTVLLGLFPAALTGSGNFKVAVAESTVTQPVSGTVTVTPSGTQAVSAVSLPLPTGAASDASTLLVQGELIDIEAQLPAALVGGRFDVNLGSVLAGLLNSDNSLPVGGFTNSFTNTPTITAGAYTSGFSLGGLITLTGVTRLAAGSGVINSITITDKAKANNAIDVIFFIANPTSTTFTDHAALTINAADLINAKYVNIPTTAYTTLATNSIATVAGIGLPIKLAAGTSLYAALVARGTTAYASTSDLQLRVAMLLD
jgi:hypothetical protein